MLKYFLLIIIMSISISEINIKNVKNVDIMFKKE